MSNTTPTAHAVSPDSGQHWTAEGAWPVAEGVHRIPLPLPMDGLKAVNVYVLETDDGLTLIDGGWAIPEARELLDTSLRSIGSGFGDIKRFLVTHVHRDHFTMATVLGHELGVDVLLGEAEKPALDLLNHRDRLTESPFIPVLVSAGAREVAEEWAQGGPPPDDAEIWKYPTDWLSGDHDIEVGRRTLNAVHTPGHTPGHFVFADQPGGLLFAGDHVLPTITPSIGFSVPPTPQPLGDFMASLAKMRSLPDLQVLPAHGPVGASLHQRVDELISHHDRRLAQSIEKLPPASGIAEHHQTSDRPELTALDVAKQLGWTRRETAYDDLDVFSQGMAAMETKAHLELLAARGAVTRRETEDGVRFARV